MQVGDSGHTGNKTLEERLVRKIFVVLLEMLLAGSDELDGDKLVAAFLEAGDDIADQPALDAVGLDSNEAGDEVSHTAQIGKRYGRSYEPGRTNVCSLADMMLKYCPAVDSMGFFQNILREKRLKRRDR